MKSCPRDGIHSKSLWLGRDQICKYSQKSSCSRARLRMSCKRIFMKYKILMKGLVRRIVNGNSLL